MIISSPFVIILSADEHHTLTVRANAARTPHRDVIRARIVLFAADGRSNSTISADLGACTWTPSVSGVDGSSVTGWPVWKDRPRSGRPRMFSAAQVAEVKALACELPADTNTPLAKWSCPDLAVEATRRGVVSSVSASTVRRWLAADAIKPRQHRFWIFPRGPDFAVKAGRVLDLYARTYDGVTLSDDEYVLSADEKPGVQARERIHPSRPSRPGRRPMLVESEYRRHGTLAYLAAYDVHQAHVIGHCAPTTGIEPFTAVRGGQSLLEGGHLGSVPVGEVLGPGREGADGRRGRVGGLGLRSGLGDPDGAAAHAGDLGSQGWLPVNEVG